MPCAHSWAWGFFAPQFGGVLNFQQPPALGAVHQGDEISSPTPHPAAPLRPSGAGWYLYPPAALGAFVGALGWEAMGLGIYHRYLFLLSGEEVHKSQTLRKIIFDLLMQIGRASCRERVFINV